MKKSILAPVLALTLGLGAMTSAQAADGKPGPGYNPYITIDYLAALLLPAIEWLR